MKTSDLFNFQFVDRSKEQKIINNFFQNITGKTLWIKGESGLGKTAFFNYVYNNWNNYSLCYINVKTESTAAEILQVFVLELQKYSDIDFLSMIKKKYKKFYNTVYKKSKDVTGEISSNISKVIIIILDIAYTAVTLRDKQVSSQEMIVEYIRNILSDRKICICIDNFSRCDIETAEIIINIFKHFYTFENFRSCIITTSEELNAEMQQMLYRELNYTEIKIEYFNNYLYFTEILSPIFELENFDTSDIEYLYKKCKGSPKKLSTVISKLLEKNGISIYDNAKAVIDKKKLFSILQSENIVFNSEDFTTAQKWIIFSYLCLNEKVDYCLLKEISLYITKKINLYVAYNDEKFSQELEKIIDHKILAYNSDNTISPQHDIDYRELQNIFDESGLKPLFSYHTFNFLKNRNDVAECQKLRCRLAYNASIDGWERLNFRYGKELSHNKQYYDAQKVFFKLSNHLNKMHIMQVLFIAINSYQTGNYKLAISQFKTISPEQLRFEKPQYYYFYYMGKSYNNIGDTMCAANLLEKALEHVDIDSREYVQTLNMLHMYYYEIDEKIDLSKNIFFKIKNEYENIYPDIWANTMRGCHNFIPYESAIKLLNKAENILSNDLEIAYIKTTKGFLYAKNDKLNNATKMFEDAASIIKVLRIHEYSYAANNLAICYMLNNKYIEAKDVLQEALLWNRTDYGDIVLQNHLMMCCINLNQQQEAIPYYDYVNGYVNKNPNADIIMKRKLYMNLAIASKQLGFEMQSKTYFDLCESIVAGTSSEWRYYALTHNTKNCPVSKPNAKCSNTLDFDPWFLVYAHD